MVGLRNLLTVFERRIRGLGDVAEARESIVEYVETTERHLEFTRRTVAHIRLFQVVALTLNNLVGHEFGEITTGEIAYHDASKLGVELAGYANRFCGPNNRPDWWEDALEHHYQNNAHHPEFWAQGAYPQPMPSAWCLAMVADWLASSYQYTGSLDMETWLDANLGVVPAKPLHPESHDITVQILRRLGYVTNSGNGLMWEWLHRGWAADVEVWIERRG